MLYPTELRMQFKKFIKTLFISLKN